MRAGITDRLGATAMDGGVNFALFSSVATAVEVCLFDTDNRECARHRLPEPSGGIWRGFLPGCAAGQRYGYRVHGAYEPERGLWCNPHKLLLDPYARALSGRFRWSAEVFGFDGDEPLDPDRLNEADSAPFVPKCRVVAPAAAPPRPGPAIDWYDTVLYELHVRGFTMRHPEVPAADRGCFAGLRHAGVLEYLRALGITTIELMPVHEFIDEQFLVDRGLRNYWGYNTLNFFTPSARYGGADPVRSFRSLVDALHDAGFEVVLDVVYNHTAEGGAAGPTLCWRGLDNQAYYRMESDHAGRYVNDTGCGNTLNADHPATQRLVLDSLRYWAQDMGVDGFRFDLAPVLGRRADGFDPAHPLWEQIVRDPVVGRTKLIAEPWDPGPGGYQLGALPAQCSEWNDRYRDAARHYWRGDPGMAAEFARRVHGSADLFEWKQCGPRSSINFVTSHDGFTLRDLVTYAHRHNEANGEDNQDGHSHNYSCNHGIEGESDDPAIAAARRRHRLNLLATLLCSQGTPMLTAGDEFGHSTGGNNNAYAQDNETAWLDWGDIDRDPAFHAAVTAMLANRRAAPLLRQREYLHQLRTTADARPDIQWLNGDGSDIESDQWDTLGAFVLILNDVEDRPPAGTERCIALVFNAGAAGCDVAPPRPSVAGRWQLRFATHADTRTDVGTWWVGPESCACFAFVAGG